MLIYKVLRSDEYAALRLAGETRGAPVDVSDGYIHFSDATTLRGTLEKHFAGEDGLMLLAVEADTLGDDLKWEPSRGGALFPHLYRRLRMDDVAWSKPVALVGGRHDLPEDLA
ncbi:DUF952 domain-containing protein [Tranquillimonas alkanivorans]|nr:DUF952 domain-containing protein [Tranquillimonas alkanivorans]